MLLKQVVHRLLDHRLVQVVAFAGVNGGDDALGFPFGGAPVERLAALDDVVHGPGDFLDRRVGIVAVAVEQVHVVELQALETAIHAFDEVLAAQRVLFQRRVVKAPEQLRRDQVRAAPPAQFLQRRAHDAFGFPAGVDLRVVEKVDAGLEGCTHHFDGIGHRGLVLECHPAAERQRGNAKAGVAEFAVLHGRFRIVESEAQA